MQHARRRTATPARTCARAVGPIERSTGPFNLLRRPASSPHLLRQPDLDQRLIRHIALVGLDLDPVEQADRQALRDRFG